MYRCFGGPFLERAVVTSRMPPELIAEVEAWATAANDTTRSEAIRRLVELGAEGEEMAGPRPAGLPWTREEDDQLRAMLKAGIKAPAIALKLRRTV
jgi:hypothetical protein